MKMQALVALETSSLK